MNKVYWRIFERDGWLEYHCSANRQEVLEGRARSQAIKMESEHKHKVMARWLTEIDNMGQLMVHA